MKLTMKFFGCLIFLQLILAVAGEYDFISSAKCHGNTKGKIKSPNKKTKCGDDGYLIINTNSRDALIAVSDGVGGWHRKKIDPGLFTDVYLDQVTKEYSRHAGKKDSCEILRGAATEMLSDNHNLKGGSATSLIAVVEKSNGKLDVCNVGDSGLLLYRNRNIVAKSGITHYRFNSPYQVSLTESRSNKLVFHPNRRNSDQIIHRRFHLHSGDVLVSATDGLLDNLFENQIAKYISMEIDAEDRVHRVNSEYFDCQNFKRITELSDRISETLLSHALRYSKKSDYFSPFQLEALNSGKHGFRGGKEDDITVVVTIVCKKSR